MTRRDGRPEVDVAHLRTDWDAIGRASGTPGIRRQPARLASLIGAVLLVLAGFFPFAEGRIVRLDGSVARLSVSGFDGPGDGAILLVIGLIALFVVVNSSMVESSSLIVRLGPPILGLLACLICVTAWRETQDWIDGLVKSGGTGSVSSGLWLAVGGSVVLMIAGTYRSVAELRAVSVDRSGWPRPSRADLAEAFGAVVGGAFLGVGLLAIAVVFLPASLIAAYVIAVLVGGLVGMSLGARLGRRFGRDR